MWETRTRCCLALVVATGALLAVPGVAAATTTTFSANGTFTVPAGVTSLAVDVRGAAGGAASGALVNPGGKGGEASGTLPVTPGEALTVLVGGPGLPGDPNGPAGRGGANGGADGGVGGGVNLGGGGGGGGRSEVDRGASRLLVAGGGGGAAPAMFALGGGGGGATGIGGGSNDAASGGGGGTQTEGGRAGGANASSGTSGDGGAGGAGPLGGGGGGGGFFGGGGGGGGTRNAHSGAGGGGSGHLDASVIDGAMTTDAHAGAGVVTFTYRVTTATALSSTFNPSTYAQPITFTAVVSGTNPTGNITFFDDGKALEGCTSIPLGTGGVPADSAVCPTGTLLPATHAITAAYTGDGTNAPSVSAVLNQVVSAAPASNSSSTPAAGAAAAAPPGPVDLGSPSNAFTFARVRVSAHSLRLSFDYPRRGTLDALVTTRRPRAEAARLRPGPHRVTVGKLHDRAESAQTRTLVIPLTRHGRRILARRGKLPIRLSLVFTPDGGESARQAHKYRVRHRSARAGSRG